MRIFTKRLLAVLLSVLMVIMVVPVSSITALAENTTEFLGGDGSEEKPYLISNKTHLNNVRNYLGAHFRMVADIVFTEADFAEDGEFYNYGLGWDPIGIDEDSAFTGVFDGDGYAIIGLYCNQDDDFTRYAGLFGNNRGTICNLGIENGRMSAAFSNDVYAGGIAGYNVGAISNCYNMGDVSARASSSYADAYAGGIAGRNDGTISTCYNTGNVSAYSKYSRVGGITGWNNSAISNCYNIGSVSASFMYSLVGGIAGRNDGVISTCYNIGSVSVSSSSYDVYIGGIAGWNNTTIADCYYLNFLVKGVGSGTDTTTKCSVEEMKQQSTFVGFDFDTGWEFAEGNIYPFPTLQAAPHFEENAEENTTDFLGGTGTPYNPYLISNKTHLNNVRNYLGAHFKMMADIVFTEADFAEDGEFYNDGRGWEPIGTDADSAFAGVFDGNGYVIVGLHCNSGIGSVSGLFGYNQGLICDLGMEDNSSVSSYSSDYAGGIVGYNGGTIDNCYNMGNVSASTYNSIRTGGIVGYNRGNIINCCNAGNIRATSISNIGTGASSYAGGITGWNGGAISNCYNTGDVSALAISTLYDNSASAVGGITGNNGGTINTCYNTGNMSASSDYSDVGGIAGYNGNTISNCYNTGDVLVRYDSNVDMGGIVGNSNGTISNCYNTGNVSAVTSSANAGGIVGYNDGFAGNCYNIGDVSTSSNGDFNVGGIVGYRTKVDSTISNCYYLDNISQGVGIGTDTTTKCTAEQMKQHSTFVGFDFDYVWEIDSYRDYHYPQLKNNRQEPIQSIELLSQSADIQVIEGLWPDSIDAVVKITYADGLEITTDVTSQMLSELDISQIGTQTIHLIYGGKVTAETIDIEVIPKSISSIAVTTLPDKTAYVQGQPLNPAGGELTVSYNNNTSEIVDLSEAQMSYPLEQTGIVTATAEYKGFSATFSVTINEKQIQSIGIIEPEKLSYIEGETLDLTGGKLQITYVSEDNYTERIPLAVDMISGYDPNVIGLQTLTVGYEGQKITFVVRVTAKSLTHIEVTKQPDKLIYIEGDDFDPTGMVVTAYYNNDTSDLVTEYVISGYDSAPGTKTITVTYEGMTAKFDVTVQAKSLTGVAVTALPDKTVYMDGETFDSAGLEITAYYNNGTSEVISDYQISGYSSTPGTKSITISYGSQYTTFNVYVLDFQMVEDMMIRYIMAMQSVYSNPADWQTDHLDIPGKATEENIDTLAMYCIMQDYYGGENSLDKYLQWDDTAAEYRYAIPIDVLLTMMEALQIPAVSDSLLLSDHYNSVAGLYTISEPSGYGGYALRREYMQVERKEDHWVITYEDPMTGDADDLMPPKAIRRFQLELTDDYNIVAFSIPLKTEGLHVISDEPVVMLEGQELDRTKFEVHYRYDNGFYKIITDYELSGYDSTPGSKTVTASYDGLIAQFDVTVKAKSLTHIAVTARPDKISYLENKDPFDPAGGKVTLYYNNDTSEAIDLTAEMVSGFDNTRVGKQTLTVTYEGFTDTFEVEITAKKLSAIKLTTLPTKLDYIEGYDSFDPAGGKVTLYYNNDTSEVIDLSAEMVSGFDNTQVGKQTLIVIYEGFNDTFEIEILAYTPGDANGDDEVNDKDAEYLLYHIFYPERYPVRQDCDFNGDGEVGDKDAEYLLYHIFYPDVYPLEI